ncbi:response regulator receiver domain-containing protein [Rhizobium sp. ERR 1071]|uniref:response regulator n=1 Tax=Rhizobium sp. ERR 1071 TaxID=2572677 RepID=UPI001199709F|nr:response regulator [Rhizobium sp. ERR1071]TWB08234.1 response regulator receiver domain-containing protein [Rhizobium sp. ERR1071]
MLVAEDDVLIRMDIAQTLRDQGWQVVEAGKVGDALGVLQRDPDFDLLLTDVHMPGDQTGLDLAKLVKDRYNHIKVVVMSGQHRPDFADAIPFDLFLPKPILNLVRELSR